METIKDIKNELNKLKNPLKAKDMQRFFKTGKGEYGEGDIFIGISVPDLRTLSKKYQALDLNKIPIFLKSSIHEERMLALFILILKYKKGSEKEQKQIYGLYIKYIKYVNNWDLVDLSAMHILGHFLRTKEKGLLYKLARSNKLWERRIAILSTFYYIKNNSFNDSINIAAILLNDKEDLIHKAVGWMLREVGKRSLEIEEKFLLKCYKIMPRTMLRYAIERFPEKKRKSYLLGKI